MWVLFSRTRIILLRKVLRALEDLFGEERGGGGILVVRLPKKNTVKKANEGKEQGHLKEKNENLQ